MIVREEKERDHAGVRRVNRLAFGQDEEADLVDQLRSGGYARLSLVAEDDGAVVGHILFSDLPIHTRDGVTVDALALAPMAVLPSHQRQGVGSALVREGLRLCAERGHRIVIVVGHPDYYPRFGFSAALAKTLASPYSGEAFMALELAPGALAQASGGEVEYPPPFEGV
jgi:putative acetyltransferase